ncbi:MAG TPA: hypothetical protein VIW67_07950, partial [Terriglobales bacterium]
MNCGHRLCLHQSLRYLGFLFAALTLHIPDCAAQGQTNQLWAINGSNVEVYDAENLTLLHSFNLGNYPSDLVLDRLQRKVYVITTDFLFFGGSSQLHEINALDF